MSMALGDRTQNVVPRILLGIAAVLLISICGCRKGGDTMAVTTAITLKSTAFEDGGDIPSKFTCDGADISPPLQWTGVPSGTRSLALICDDLDSPRRRFVHWVVYNLPADTSELPEGLPGMEALPGGGRQGANDFGKIGYGGPCPGVGKHRYIFRIYAVDSDLDLSERFTKADLVEAMKGHVLAEGQLMGLYERK